MVAVEEERALTAGLLVLRGRVQSLSVLDAERTPVVERVLGKRAEGRGVRRQAVADLMIVSLLSTTPKALFAKNLAWPAKNAFRPPLEIDVNEVGRLTRIRERVLDDGPPMRDRRPRRRRRAPLMESSRREKFMVLSGQV